MQKFLANSPFRDYILNKVIVVYIKKCQNI